MHHWAVHFRNVGDTNVFARTVAGFGRVVGMNARPANPAICVCDKRVQFIAFFYYFTVGGARTRNHRSPPARHFTL